MKIIINADEFGLSQGINSGIIDGYIKGIITSTTVMANMPAFEHALMLRKRNTFLGMGLHLNLTKGKPVCDDITFSTDENGVFFSKNKVEEFFSEDDAYKEFMAQIEKLIEFGFYPTHLDSHHHVHTMETFKNVVFELAKKYELPVRISDEKYRDEARKFGLKTADYFLNPFMYNSDENILIDRLKKLPKDSVVEVMTHPGYMDEETAKMTSYSYKREAELETLISLKDNRALKSLNVEFITYADLNRSKGYI